MERTKKQPFRTAFVNELLLRVGYKFWKIKKPDIMPGYLYRWTNYNPIILATVSVWQSRAGIISFIKLAEADSVNFKPLAVETTATEEFFGITPDSTACLTPANAVPVCGQTKYPSRPQTATASLSSFSETIFIAPLEVTISRITLSQETGLPIRAAVAVVSPTAIGS